MEPRISSLIEENSFLKFTITDCNVSIANALRRIIISDIPTFVFRTFPYSENKCEIYKNTTRFNNEIIKQRLGCIPIYIDDVNFPYKDYVMELNVKNDSDTIQYITTKDFKIKNKKRNNTPNLPFIQYFLLIKSPAIISNLLDFNQNYLIISIVNKYL